MVAFPGPLFIVGSPRSGTKLLRELLNRSAEINLCNPETHFIPYLYRKYGAGKQPAEVDLDEFYHDFNSTPFQIFSRRMGKPVMSREDLDAFGAAAGWAEAFETILRFYGDPAAPATALWGDKTPSYVLEMRLLKEIFPRARFVHLIRDPRDVALSARHAWGHNLYRVAAKWARDLATSRRDAVLLGDDYLEVFYERLLEEPERELRAVCGFVGRPFVPELMSLGRPAENIGDAKGKRFIDPGNVRKYRTALSPRQQRRIEEIVLPALAGTPYRADFAARHRPLSTPERTALTVIDGARSALRHVRRKGLVDGIRINIGNRVQKRRRFRDT